APARVETIRQQLAILPIVDLQAITSVLHRDAQFAASTRWNHDGRGFDQFVGFGESGMPATLIVEAPVVLAILTKKANRHGCCSLEVSVPVAAKNFKFCA